MQNILECSMPPLQFPFFGSVSFGLSDIKKSHSHRSHSHQSHSHQSHSHRWHRSQAPSYDQACGHHWKHSVRSYHHTRYATSTLAIDPCNTISNRHYDQIVIFGDSLSDTGNLFTALKGILGPNSFPPPPYFQGRFSNGPNWVDQLTPQLGLKPNQVLNFAVGGATTGLGNVAPLLLPGVPLPPLPGLLGQVNQYRGALGSKPANPNALNVIFAGGNDFLTSIRRLKCIP
jgi:GDSL-like Lipase/Acylhydrolase